MTLIRLMGYLCLRVGVVEFSDNVMTWQSSEERGSNIMDWSKRGRHMIGTWGTKLKILGFPGMVFQLAFYSNLSESCKTALKLLLWQAYDWGESQNLSGWCFGTPFSLLLYVSLLVFLKSHKKMEHKLKCTGNCYRSNRHCLHI